MSITIRKYVDITSAVGAGTQVRTRDLILRIFTGSLFQPADAVLEFRNATDVARHFGIASREYAEAAAYFSFVSKSATRPKLISFASHSETGVNANVIGGQITATWAALAPTVNAMADGAAGLSLVLAGGNTPLTVNDLTTATSFADVATALQAAFTAASEPATVSYDPALQAIIIESAGQQDPYDLVATNPTGESLLSVLLLDASGRRSSSPGAPAREPVESVRFNADMDNNFASFKFITTPTMEQDKAIGAFLSEQNFAYIYLRRSATQGDAVDAWEELGSYEGIANHYAPDPADLVDLLPAALLAATDFTRRAANKNYMFQTMPGVQASVTSTPESDDLDAVRANYYGRTQTAGQYLAFYQRGVLFGGPQAATDLNVYANEIWFKDEAQAVLMSLLLNLEALPANQTGRSYVMAALQEPIDTALMNGVISLGKTFNVVQKIYIQEQTGDELAWVQVRDKGYWIDAQVQSETTESGAVEYYISYLLIYSKGDAVRRIVGSHILI